MISICCCIFNGKWDIKHLAETIFTHNNDVELSVTLDDRVEDGAKELLDNLVKIYPQLKVTVHSEIDTIDYMKRALFYYREENIFPIPLVDYMDRNLDLYKAGKFLDKSSQFLWQSSGILYNKAVEASSGDTILIMPGDFIPLFNPNNLDHYVQNNTIGGQFYSSPNAIWARVTNMDEIWLKKLVQEVFDGTYSNLRPQYRWDGAEAFRDYLRYPHGLDQWFLPDFRRNELIRFTDPEFTSKAERYCRESIQLGGVQLLKQFHGVHVMTRKTFNHLGGFSEEWIHRAFADDKMTYRGTAFAGRSLPDEFSIAWLSGGELLETYGPGYPAGWQETLKQRDPLWNKHPIAPKQSRKYLYDGKISDADMAFLTNRSLSKSDPPRKIR